MTEKIVEKDVPAIKFGKCPRCDEKGYYIETRDPNLIDICMVCMGEGKIKLEPGMKVCGRCKGKGKMMVKHMTPFGMQKQVALCDRCKGACIVMKK